MSVSTIHETNRAYNIVQRLSENLGIRPMDERFDTALIEGRLRLAMSLESWDRLVSLAEQSLG